MKLNYQRQGQGPSVILIHGLFGSLDNLNTLAKTLVAHYDVISVDVRNHGRSPRTEQMDYPQMAQDIVTLIEQLKLSQAWLIGHSMGGKIAMMTAGLAPHLVTGLVIADMAPVAYPKPRHTEVFAGLTAVMETNPTTRKQADAVLAQHITMPEVRQFLLKSFIPHSEAQTDCWRFNVQALQDNYAHIMAWPGIDPAFNKPVLFIKGGESDYLLPEYQPQVLRQFPKATAKVIPNTGHWLHAEKPELFNRLVMDFLN
ncbi:alpha/beta fold hydrolase [Oceanisphaera avium]|uniref:Alpha/beta hydrolase n=1 Tax=Oceanisphaera avium TaxID=1903694 RepID=A0A1Y0CVW0_9GAMM|nr:alpha/beta fold hydrolase [Oceanisphaera avium]ART79066.1 alpha/beta hydrolase [Oceanisphaera avium]